MLYTAIKPHDHLACPLMAFIGALSKMSTRTPASTRLKIIAAALTIHPSTETEDTTKSEEANVVLLPSWEGICDHLQTTTFSHIPEALVTEALKNQLTLVLLSYMPSKLIIRLTVRQKLAHLKSQYEMLSSCEDPMGTFVRNIDLSSYTLDLI
eukprot:gene5608-188_t